MSETEKAKPSANLSDLLERTKKYADVREKVDKEYGQLTNTLSETLALEERAELEVKANFESLQQAIQERNGAVEALSRIVLFRTDVNKREKELLAAMAAVILEKGKSKLLSGDLSDTIPAPKDVEQQQAIEKEQPENEEEGEAKEEEEQSDENEKKSDEEMA
uniref:Tubulin-specific chaperone A n=1 Tax=Globodera pallida TaxID=36090 RepID=A0A183CHG5_GLOPA